MEKENNFQTPEAISAFINHFQKSRIILTAFELDIFTIIGNAGMSSSEVAKAVGSDQRATDRLLNAVCVTGFLSKKDGKFYNTPESLKFFNKESPDYMAGLGHSISLWDTWTFLTKSVMKGCAAHQRPENINDRESKWLEHFIEAMHYRASRQAPQIISKINLENVRRVLDLGGGSGAFAFAFVKAGKDITATIFDLPNVTPLTMKYILQEGMQDKVNTADGDYNTDTLPKGYDIIFLSAVVHINSFEGNVNLIRKCAASLNPGGQVIIQDQVMNDDRISPPNGALFALNMLVGTKEGDTYTENEMCQWFEKAGLKFESRIETFMGNCLITGRKK